MGLAAVWFCLPVELLALPFSNACRVSGNTMGKQQETIEELVREYPVVLEMDVRWGDMDAFNHVNNVAYLRYFESARIAYFEALDPTDLHGTDGVGMIPASTYCRFKFPLTYPDRISAAAWSVDFGTDHLTQQYLVGSHTHNRVAATGDGTMVAFDYRKNVKTRMPERVREYIEALEACVSICKLPIQMGGERTACENSN